jgi:hypothetical protein
MIFPLFNKNMVLKTLRKIPGATKHLLKKGKRTVKKGIKYAKKNPVKAAAVTAAALFAAPTLGPAAASLLPTAYMSKRPRKTLRSLAKNKHVLTNPVSAAAWMVNRAASNVRSDIDKWNRKHKNSAIRG